MRIPLLLVAALLLACSEDPPAPPFCPSPPAEEPGNTVPSPPPLLSEDREMAAEPPEAPAPLPEPARWGEIEKSIRDEPAPEDEVVRRDLNATKLLLDFEKMPIEKAVTYLAEKTAKKIELQMEIYQENTKEGLRLTIDTQTVTGVQALDRICAAKGLTWWIAGGVVKIGTVTRAPFVEVLYPIDAIRGHQADAIADRVREDIAPDVWDEGGEVSVQKKGVLFVKAPKAVQRKVLALLRKLRKP